MEQLNEKFPDCIIFIRGDANCSSKCPDRSALFHHFIHSHNFKKVTINHPTYHHFTGNGGSDSDVDILLHSDQPHVSEVVINILCKLDHPTLLSHHDIIISKCSFPFSPQNDSVIPDPRLITAPRIENIRTRTIWDSDSFGVTAQV